MYIRPCPQEMKVQHLLHQRSGSVCHIRAIAILGKRVLSQSFTAGSFMSLSQSLPAPWLWSRLLSTTPHRLPVCSGPLQGSRTTEDRLPRPFRKHSSVAAPAGPELRRFSDVLQYADHYPVKYQWSWYLWLFTCFYCFKTISHTLLRWVYSLRYELL